MEIQLALAGSSVLYHLTPLKFAAKIVSEDRFKLKTVLSNRQEIAHDNGRAYFFMSFARTPHNAYFKHSMSRLTDYVVFVVDGQKLGANYKIRPVDYFHFAQEDQAADETEDRLISTKSEIPCLKYVKEIHYSNGNAQGLTQDTRILLTAAKRKNIPLFRYSSNDELVKLDRRKALPVDMRPYVIRNKRRPVPRKKFGYAPNRGVRNNTAKAWWRAIAQPVKSGDKQAQFLGVTRDPDIADIRADVYSRLFEDEPVYAARSFNSAIENGFQDTPAVEKIVRFMRKHEYKPIDVINFLLEKWA